jgi:hypothetical protein
MTTRSHPGASWHKFLPRRPVHHYPSRTWDEAPQVIANVVMAGPLTSDDGSAARRIAAT